MLTAEQVKNFYEADLFVPGLFDHIFFLILGLILPFVDYATDYYNAGPDSNIKKVIPSRKYPSRAKHGLVITLQEPDVKNVRT